MSAFKPAAKLLSLLYVLLCRIVSYRDRNILMLLLVMLLMIMMVITNATVDQ